MWLPLIRKFQLIWPHFSTCFFFQLVSRLCILNGKKQIILNNNSQQNGVLSSLSSSNTVDDGNNNNIEIFLMGWIRILLSDKWHEQCEKDYAPSGSSRSPRNSPPPTRGDDAEEVEKRKGSQGRKDWALPAAKMCVIYPGSMTTTLLNELVKFNKEPIEQLLKVHNIVNKHVITDFGSGAEELPLNNKNSVGSNKKNKRKKAGQTSEVSALSLKSFIVGLAQAIGEWPRFLHFERYVHYPDRRRGWWQHGGLVLGNRQHSDGRLKRCCPHPNAACN